MTSICILQFDHGCYPGCGLNQSQKQSSCSYFRAPRSYEACPQFNAWGGDRPFKQSCQRHTEGQSKCTHCKTETMWSEDLRWESGFCPAFSRWLWLLVPAANGSSTTSEFVSAASMHVFKESLLCLRASAGLGLTNTCMERCDFLLRHCCHPGARPS